MAALSQCRALAGSRAFGTVRPKQHKVVCNGSKVFMRRKDSYVTEVLVGEDESEDLAVRRFMKSVVQSGVINQLRARRTKETKIQEYKRKLQERAMIRKLKLVEPTWEELYGEDMDPKPFDDFFTKGADDDLFSDIQNTGYGPGMNDFGDDMVTDFRRDNFNYQGGYMGGYTGYTGGYEGGYMSGSQFKGGYTDIPASGTDSGYQGGYQDP